MSKQKSNTKLPDLIRISDAAKLLGVTPMTLRRWDKAEILKAYRVGVRGDRKYKKVDILNVLENGLNKT